jgi:nucleotide-binding universal stress UspA family protein
MFKHLLVPLDGSALAEAALPAASYLAQTMGASATLIHIIEADAPQEIHGERHLSEPGEAYTYLEGVARAFPPGLSVECHVHTLPASDVARGIVEHVDEFAPDLIVMCTHGSGGLLGLVVGSIAQQVIALGKTPVLLVHPGGHSPSRVATEETTAGTAPSPGGGGGSAWGPLRRLLVPLDGNPDHEQGISVAAGMAAACGAGLYLLRAVHTSGSLTWQSAATARMLPSMTHAYLDLAQEEAVAYLRRRIAGLEGSGLVVAAEVQRGNPADVIVKMATKVQADLIVLSTHGRSQMDAFWSGSVTPKVAGRTNVPLLLVPVPETEPER